MITVKVSGDVKGLGQFTPVKVTDLVATTWTMADRSGVSFSASKVEAVAPRGRRPDGPVLRDRAGS